MADNIFQNQGERSMASQFPVFSWRRFGGLSTVCIALGTGLLGPAAAHAQSLAVVVGKVQLVRGNTSVEATPNMRLQQGDVLKSDANGEALMRFDDGARIALRSGTEMEFKDLQTTGPLSTRQKTVRLIVGGLRYISGIATVRKNVIFITNDATVGIRGTDIELAVTEDALLDNNPGTYLKVNTGAAVLTATDGARVDVAPGEVAYGGEPDPTTRGAGTERRPAARKVPVATPGLFKPSSLDSLMR
jgi:hypothetical protein